MAKRNGSYPLSVQPGIPHLPDTPDGWKAESLGKHLEVIKRPLDMKNDELYQLVTIRRSRGGADKRECLRGKDIKVKSQFYVREGDFVISKRQIAHGACAVIPKELDGAIVSNEYSVLRPKGDLDLNYLRYLSETIHFQQTCFHSSVGIHVEKMIFKLDWWFKFDFNVPPLPEQKKIVRVLSTWDKAISIVSKIIKTNELRKKSLLHYLLSGHVRFNGYEKKNFSKGRLVEHIKSIKGGGTPSKSNQLYWNGSIPWVTVKDLVKPIISDSKEKITDLGLTNSAANLIPQNAVIVSTRMAVGKSVMATCNVAIKQDLKAIFLKDTILPKYLHYWFQGHSKKIECLGSGSTVKGISLHDLKSLKMSFIPSTQEQEEVLACLDISEASIEKYSCLLTLQKTTRKSLMQKLLTGKCRVMINNDGTNLH